MVIRIAREFGSHVLPLPHGYLDASGWRTQGDAPWSQMLEPWKLDLLPRCVQDEGKPGWEPAPRGIGFSLIIPSTSEMARLWGPDNMLLGGLNHTSLGLVEIS